MISKKKKIAIGCLGSAALVLLIILGVLSYILSMIFDNQPAPVVQRVPNPQHLQSALKKIYSVLKTDSDNKTNAGQSALNALGLGNIDLENPDPNEIIKNIDFDKALKVLSDPDALTGSLTLDSDEINALIDSGFSAKMAVDMTGDEECDDTRIYNAYFKDGRFTVDFTAVSGIPTPFGRYCNIEVVFVPQIIDHHLKLELYSGKAGEWECPVEYLKETLDEQLRLYEDTDDGKALLAIITNLEVQKEKVVLEYNLKQLATLMMNKSNIDIIQKMGSGSKISGDDIMKLLKSKQ